MSLSKTIRTGLCVAVAVGISWLCTTDPASARIYRYVDNSGVTHYTDDALKVPEDQRPPLDDPVPQPAIKKKADSQASSAEGEVLQEKAEQTVLAKKAEIQKQQARLDLRFEQLSRQKKQLDAEFEAIGREKAQLEKERVVKHSSRTYRIFNQKVKKLDERIQVYNKRRAAYERQAARYNQAVRQLEEQRNRLNGEIESFNQAKAMDVKP